jgi:hypothetical protein
MKGHPLEKQITRVSSPQNGKVFGILVAVISALLCLPLFLIMFFLTPAIDEQGNAGNFRGFFPLVIPISYLVFGYLWIALGSAVCNFFMGILSGLNSK